MKPHPVIRALKRYLDSNDFPFLLPLPPWAAPGARAIRRIRRSARTAMRRREVARRGRIPVCCSMAVWPAMALVKAWREVRAGYRLHRGLAASLLDTWWLQLAHNLRTADIRYHRLDLRDQRRTVNQVVTDEENKCLMEALNRGHIAEDLGDKIVFAAFCSRHRLPAPPLLSSCRGHGAPVQHLQAWPAADLFLKSTNAWGGHGIHRLRHAPATASWHCHHETDITPASIGAVARRLVGDGPWLLQPRMRNGPELADFVASPEAALATVRVITGRILPRGEVGIIGGFMRFPLRDAIVDNLCAGGLGADFDPATGRLLAARRLLNVTAPLAHHPETGGLIEGRIIPRWEEVAALARRAHAQIDDIATLGWDIAVTAEGPILIETNPHWGVPLDIPLGHTSYARFVIQPALQARLP